MIGIALIDDILVKTVTRMFSRHARLGSHPSHAFKLHMTGCLSLFLALEVLVLKLETLPWS